MYTGSKHAIHGYFESLRSEKVGTGLEVCMLCPGPTFSNLLAVASTEKLGEKFGESMNAADKRILDLFQACSASNIWKSVPSNTVKKCHENLGSQIPGKS